MSGLHEAMRGIVDFVMWTLVFERAWYFRFGLPADVGAMLAA